MTNFTYKSKDGGDFFLPGIGASKDGKITVSGKLESQALELVEDGQQTPPTTEASTTEVTEENQHAA